MYFTITCACNILLLNESLLISYIELFIQVKDAVGNLYSSYDGEYSYTPVQDALSGTAKHKMRHRREKGIQSKWNGFFYTISTWNVKEEKCIVETST